MADPVAAVTNAPKRAFSFAQNNLVAFLLLALVLLVAFVAYEARNPGKIRQKVQKIPGVGPWATGIKAV